MGQIEKEKRGSESKKGPQKTQTRYKVNKLKRKRDDKIRYDTLSYDKLRQRSTPATSRLADVEPSMYEHASVNNYYNSDSDEMFENLAS